MSEEKRTTIDVPDQVRRVRSVPMMRESVNLSIPIEDLPDRSIQCCDRKTNPKMLSFFVKVFVSLLVLCFSMYKLWLKPSCDCENDAVVYVSLITSILSVWIGVTVGK